MIQNNNKQRARAPPCIQFSVCRHQFCSEIISRAVGFIAEKYCTKWPAQPNSTDSWLFYLLQLFGFEFARVYSKCIIIIIIHMYFLFDTVALGKNEQTQTMSKHFRSENITLNTKLNAHMFI